MDIIKKTEADHQRKPEADVHYYHGDEYEMILVEQDPHTTQTWHRHDIVTEAILMTRGELVAMWEEDGVLKEEVVRTGDFFEAGRFHHTTRNDTGEIAQFVVIKMVPTGTNTREIRRNDKVVVDPPGTGGTP